MKIDCTTPVLKPQSGDTGKAIKLSSMSVRWSLVAESLLALLAFDLLCLGRDFRRLHNYVKRWPISVPKRGALGSSDSDVREVCEALNYAAVCYPKRLRCLQRAAVLTCLLRHRGVAAKFVIGVQSLPFRAHAWTEVEGVAVNERRDVRRLYQTFESC